MTETHKTKTSNITDSLANKSLRVSTILVDREQMKTHTDSTNKHRKQNSSICNTERALNTVLYFPCIGRAIRDVQEVRQAFVWERPL